MTKQTLNYDSFTTIKNISDFLHIWLKNQYLDGFHQKILNEYYSNYKKNWNEYIQFHYTNQTFELMEILSKIDQPKVLEVGCGCGTESLWIAYHGTDVTAIDISHDRLSVAQERKKSIEKCLNKKIKCSFELKSLFDLDINNQFDIIWMEQALHHIEPRSEALDRLCDLLKPKGFIVISEANALNPLIQLHLLKRRGLKTIREYVDNNGIKHIYGNERVLTLHQLSIEFSKRNIVQQTGRYFRVFPNKYWATYFLKVEKYIPSWLTPIFTHYNYVGKKN